MKRVIVWILAMSIWACGLHTQICSAQAPPDVSQAEQLLTEYFQQLEQGNTARVLALLTGPMRTRREVVLRNNPQYADMLRERYQNASFEVTSFEPLYTSMFLAEARVYLGSDENMVLRFTLSLDGGMLRIYSEEEIPVKDTKESH